MITKWYNVEEDVFPHVHEPVLLAKKRTEDIEKNCLLGRLVSEDNTGEKGWFVGNDMAVITLTSRKYRSYLIEKPLAIPGTSDLNVLEKCLKEYMAKLAIFEKSFKNLQNV